MTACRTLLSRGFRLGSLVEERMPVPQLLARVFLMGQNKNSKRDFKSNHSNLFRSHLLLPLILLQLLLLEVLTLLQHFKQNTSVCASWTILDTKHSEESTCQRRRPAASSAEPCVWSLHSHGSSSAGLGIYTRRYLCGASDRQIIFIRTFHSSGPTF